MGNLKTKNKSLFIYAGCEIGRLTIIKPVERNDDILDAAQTPYSYRHQGKLWQCECKCGRICYYSEHALERQKVKSCGCLRLSILRGAELGDEKKQRKMRLDADIRKLFVSYQRARSLGNAPEETRLFNEIAALSKLKEKL